jgi:predicted acylesterase/phospholipase RssA
MFAESLYDITPFRRLLCELIDFDRLNSLEAKLVLESVNVETGELQKFSNHDEKGINVEHIISSMSIPPNFPMVKIGQDHFWDGGLYANMPLAPAINHLEIAAKDEEKVQRELIVISLFRKASPLPSNMYEISNRIKEIIFESKMGLDIKMFEMMDAQIDLLAKINEELPKNSPIRDNPTFKRWSEHRKIDKRIFLKYQAEGVEGTDNFTAEKIDYRAKKGYADASFHCKN